MAGTLAEEPEARVRTWSAAPCWASSDASRFLSELQFFVGKMGGYFLQTQR